MPVPNLERPALEVLSGVRHFSKFAFIVMLASLAFTAFLSYEAKKDADRYVFERFAADSEEMRIQLSGTLAAHEQVLLGAAGFFDASSSVTRDEWNRYTSRIKLDDHFKSVQGLGLSLWIPHQQLSAHIASVRREGFPKYEIWPPQVRDAYTSIVYLEPFSGRNLRAFGYDMYSEPTRRDAMERARDTNAAALSGRVTLVQETVQDVQAGTLMYIPLYKKGMPHDTIAERRAALYGWVYSPFRMKDMVENAIASHRSEGQTHPLHLSIYDGSKLDSQNLLYSDNGEHVSSNSPFSIQQRFQFGGRDWTMVTEPRDTQAADVNYGKSRIIFFSGSLASILLYFLITALSQTRVALNKASTAVNDLRKSEDNLRVLSKNESVLVWIAGSDGKCTYFNQVWLDYTGRSLEQEWGDGWVDGLHPEDKVNCLQGYIEAFNARREFTLEYRLRHHSGEYRWIVDHGVPRHDENGNFLGYIGSCVDINDKKSADTQLKLSMFAMDKAFDAIYWLDKDGHIRYVNNGGSRSLGYSREEFLQLSITDLDPDLDQDDWKTLWTELRENKTQLLETRHRRKDGAIIPIEISANHIELGEFEYNIAFCRDITARKIIEQEIYSLAFFDPLTHLPNRRMLHDRLSKSIANSKRQRAYGSLLFLDLDNFKPVNDRFGHEAGDQLLLEVAKRLTATVREIDTVARYGGDEFVVLLGDLSSSPEKMQEQAQVVARKIAAVIAEPYHLNQRIGEDNIPIVHECTSSIGVTLFDGTQDTQDDILTRGDNAMYRAKEMGRNQVQLYAEA